MFEGWECGGYIGFLSSFVLWEIMIVILLEVVFDEVGLDIYVLFVGGIYDNCFVKMVSVMVVFLVV